MADHLDAGEPARPAQAVAPNWRTSAERWVFAVALALILFASWAWLLYQDWAMRHMDLVDMAMPGTGAWDAGDLALVFVMWAVMMIAMMVPSATPMLLVYRRVARARTAGSRQLLMTGAFLSGYVMAWTAYSVLATLVQWGLHSAALTSPGMVATSPAVGGALLVAAGAYQCTPLKQACLLRCSSPFQFLLTAWRIGAAGALRMGFVHGSYCVGCCWLLMAVLFVVGVMNLLWVALLAGFVLIEKLAPHGVWISRVSGTGLIAWGLWLIGTGVALPG
jgi:predicted metal-binding membrane protein